MRYIETISEETYDRIQNDRRQYGHMKDILEIIQGATVLDIEGVDEETPDIPGMKIDGAELYLRTKDGDDVVLAFEDAGAMCLEDEDEEPPLYVTLAYIPKS